MIMQAIVNFVDDFKNKYIRVIANVVCMIVSCGLTVYGMIQLFSSPILKIVIGIFIGTIDVWMQYLLAYGRWIYKQISKGEAIQYFIAYGLYALFFNFFLSIGFFVMETEITDRIFEENSIADTAQYAKQRIKEIDDDLNIIRDYQRTETSTGFGGRSETLKEDKKSLEQNREKYMKVLLNASKTNESSMKVNRNIFNSLESVFKPLFGWTANQFKIVMFGMLILVMQFGLIKTSWNINPHAKVTGSTLPDDKKDILKWLDAAFEGRSNGALNGVATISELSELSTDRCIQIRDYLSKFKVNGDYAIAVAQGASRNNYGKEFIRDYILSH